jgi:hypothetical protein
MAPDNNLNLPSTGISGSNFSGLRRLIDQPVGQRLAIFYVILVIILDFISTFPAPEGAVIPTINLVRPVYYFTISADSLNFADRPESISNFLQATTSTIWTGEVK